MLPKLDGFLCALGFCDLGTHCVNREILFPFTRINVGLEKKAIRFLKKPRKMTHDKATMEVAQIRMQLGIV